MRTIIPPDTVTVPPNAEKVFSGQIFDVYHWPQTMFDGSVETFEMIKRTDTVQIIAIRDGKLVVTTERQPDSERVFVGVPGGRHDHENETELNAAKRELLEETGLRFKNWKLIDVVNPIVSTRKIDWLVYTFIATDFIDETAQKLDAGEKISVQYMDFDEYLQTDSRSDSIKEIIERAGNIDGLLNFPEYKN